MESLSTEDMIRQMFKTTADTNITVKKLEDELAAVRKVAKEAKEIANKAISQSTAALERVEEREKDCSSLRVRMDVLEDAGKETRAQLEHQMRSCKNACSTVTDDLEERILDLNAKVDELTKNNQEKVVDWAVEVDTVAMNTGVLERLKKLEVSREMTFA